MLRVVQYSDLHFSTSGERSHGGFGYDTDEAWKSIFAHTFDADGTAPDADLAICTGDIADHGWADEYLKAQGHLSHIPVPVAVVPGNHDYHVPFESRLPTPGNRANGLLDEHAIRSIPRTGPLGSAQSAQFSGISMQRTIRLGTWLFILADSNRFGREEDALGRLVDTDQRIEGIGGFGDREVAWIDEMIAETDADHVFIWVHHPPAMTGPLAQYMSTEYHEDFVAIAGRNPKLKGIAAGHVHADLVADLDGVPVYVCPAFTINLDYENGTLLPPGYRTFDFGDDGSIASECHLIEDDRWPRSRLPKTAIAFLSGEASIDDVKEALGIAKDAPSPF